MTYRCSSLNKKYNIKKNVVEQLVANSAVNWKEIKGVASHPSLGEVLYFCCYQFYLIS